MITNFLHSPQGATAVADDLVQNRSKRTGSNTSVSAKSRTPQKKFDVRFEFGPNRKDILSFTNQLSVMIVQV
jgi:hypothetical protein